MDGRGTSRFGSHENRNEIPRRLSPSPLRLDSVLASLIAQVKEPDGFALPDDTGSALIWVVFFAVVTGLWVVLGRTRRRAEEDYRKRMEGRNERETPPLE